MTALPNDYDSDPGRFLSAGKHPHDDVHPSVAARFAAAGARTMLDVGGGNGRLARLLPGLSMRCLLIDLSPVMLSLAPRPVVRANGARLPVAGACADAVAALYTLYHYDDPLEPVREARRVLRPGGLFASLPAVARSESARNGGGRLPVVVRAPPGGSGSRRPGLGAFWPLGAGRLAAAADPRDHGVEGPYAQYEHRREMLDVARNPRSAGA